MRTAITRALVALFWLSTAAYALLSASEFASQQFLQPQLVPALTQFARSHAWVSLTALAATAAGLWPQLRSGDRRVIVFLAAWLCSVILEVIAGPLASLQPSARALTVSVAALVPAAWLSLLDLRPPGMDHPEAADDAGVVADGLACLLSALLVTGVQAGLTVIDSPMSAGWTADLGRATILDAALFAVVFATLSLVRGIARMSPDVPAAEGWLTRSVVAVIVASYVHRIVMPALSLPGSSTILVSAAFGVSLALAIAPRGTRSGGVGGGLSALCPQWSSRSAVHAAAWVGILVAGSIAIQHQVARYDWNSTIGKLFALGTWLSVLALMLRLTPRWLTRPRRPRIVATIAPYAACLVVLLMYQATWSGLSAGTDPRGTAWKSTDVGSRLIADAIAHRPAASDGGLYEYLQRNTNIPHSVQVAPVDVAFNRLDAPAARRPHIFLFVVDSLRRDYLSPYNGKVSFTPAIGAFAEESTVFERAFTRYGATGLAVPSIWTGGLLLHKQYVTPFGPMNTLAKLLDAAEYRRWMSMEHIVETIVPASPWLEPLDAGVEIKDQRLCQTLREVRGRLGELEAGEPAFVYSLPQDVHISTIMREGAAAIDQGRYDGFNAAYASRVRRFDACFGEFIGDLKARGLYDDSLIVLTADHGDSLGEEGRMGHAYTVFPEIVQVPLLVHLPASMRGDYQASPSAVAFTSDITPTVYSLLGQAPVAPSPLFGQSLYRTPADGPLKRQPAEMVASSYGSVYGALLDDAKRLYIADAVGLREYEYELDGSGAGRQIDVRQGDRSAGQQAIRSTVEEISRFYRYAPGR